MLWKPVPGYEDLYLVSDEGQVMSIRAKRVLKPLISKGYRRVALRAGGRERRLGIHQVMALAFLPNPDGLPVVRHLDDDRTHNVLSNLAWGSYADNTADAVRNERWPKREMCTRGLHPRTPENLVERKATRNGSPRTVLTCRPCERLRARERHAKNRDMENARARERHVRDREAHLVAMREYRASHRSRP